MKLFDARVWTRVRAIIGARSPPVGACRELVGQLELRDASRVRLDTRTRKDDVLEFGIRCDVERIFQRTRAVGVCVLKQQLERLIPRSSSPNPGRARAGSAWK